MTLAELRAAFSDLAGEPVHVMELRRSEPGLPNEMEVLFFQPPEAEELAADEFFTFVATAGMSTQPMRGPCPRAELILRVQGRRDWDDLRLIGRALAEFAVMPFREKMCLKPNLVVSGVTFPIFTGMDCALITEMGVH